MAVIGTPSVVEDPGPNGMEIWNHSQVPTAEVLSRLPSRFNDIIASMGRWAASTRTRAGSLWDRDRFVTPDNIFDQMKLAYEAVETDDIVSNVLESTEALAFSKVGFYADDPDEQNIYNQIAADVDLDSRLREMWRELFTVSQVYCAVWWHTKTYKVDGKNRKKALTLRCPKAITVLDPLKVIPIGMPMFGMERLAWVADRAEAQRIKAGPSDEIFKRLILGPYEPTEQERQILGGLNLAGSELFELNPANVFRHTATRPGYQSFASVRMKSIFELLDQKHQLRSMDRAHLIGGTNFIVLITQGSDLHPLKPDEFAHLQAQVRTVAQTPVLVGDHRLDVKIVTPSLDNTLKPDRYDTVDVRIMARLYQMFVRGQGGDRSDNSEGLIKVVAAGMESRRKMLRRTLEDHILDPMFEQNDNLKTPPRLLYHPKEIALSFDANFASFLLELRTMREISRYTILNQFGISEEFEADMLEREEELFDNIFKTINPNNQGVPGQGGAAAPTPTKATTPAKKAAPKKEASNTVKRQGGRNKGGAAPGTGQGQAPRRPRKLAADRKDDDGNED